MKDSEKLIREIHNAMIESAKNTCKTKAEPYQYGSQEYNEVYAMVESTYAPITSHIIATKLKDPNGDTRLSKLLTSIPTKMPLKLAQKIDELDIQKTEEGKLGEYPVICATTEVAGREAGTSLCDGCIQTLNNANSRTQSAISDEVSESFSPRTATV